MATLQHELGASATPLSRPEAKLRADNMRRYERGGVVYAGDGRLGTLRQVIVDETTREVTALVIQLDGRGELVLLPPQAVSKTGGSAVFLSGTHHQFDEWLARAPRYQVERGAKANLKKLLRAEPRPAGDPWASVIKAGKDYIETGSLALAGANDDWSASRQGSRRF
jgi:hypothetical protein